MSEKRVVKEVNDMIVRSQLYTSPAWPCQQSQSRRLGRVALQDACQVGMTWPADAIRQDAYDTEAGAGPFYTSSGFRECGRAVYQGDPLRYNELLLAPPPEG